MFKNPIKKYQSGGSAPTQEQQQQIAQLFEAASKNTGIDVETLMNAANQLQDENQIKSYVKAISLAAQGDQNAIASIKKMFSQAPSQFAKEGGKLHDFICKHAGGKKIAGCGCKNDDIVIKNQNGSAGIPFNNASALEAYLTPQMPNSDSLFTGQQVASLINGIRLNQPLVQTQEDGGKVEKDQNPASGIGDTTNNTEQKRSAFKRFKDKWIGSKMPGNVNFYKWQDDKGKHYQVLGASNKKTMTINGTDSTLVNQNTMPTGNWSYEEIPQGSSEWRKFLTVYGDQFTLENGGVVKDQNPAEPMPEPDSSVFGTLKEGKSRSKVSATIDNNSKARHFVKGIKQFSKSAVARLPLAGAVAYGAAQLGALPAVQEIGEIAPIIAKYGGFSAMSQLRPKFLINTVNPYATPKVTWHNAFWAVPEDNVMDKIDSGTKKSKGAVK